MRKVKFTQQNTIKRLQQIIDEFPRLEVRCAFVLVRPRRSTLSSRT